MKTFEQTATADERIKSVEKGWGEDSLFFSTWEMVAPQFQVDEIKLESCQVGQYDYIWVYRGYKDGKKYFEMGYDSDITVIYQTL